MLNGYPPEYASIHTPTQGVTTVKARLDTFKGFNPHTHAGCDTSGNKVFTQFACFNLHIPEHTRSLSGGLLGHKIMP